MNVIKKALSITMPPRIASLNRDARGLPIPYTVKIGQDGLPDFRIIDPVKWQRAVKCRICGICGESLGAHIAFVGGPASIANRLFTDLPMHRDCAIYALQACPFLAAPNFAYSKSMPDGSQVNEHVSTTRPDRFGLGMSKGFDVTMLGGTDIVLRAHPFSKIEWWRHGVMEPATP